MPDQQYPGLPRLEDAIVERIVDRFFEPTIIGYQPGPRMMPVPHGTGMIPIQEPVYREPQLAELARHLFDNKRKEIIDAVWEKIDVGTLAETIAARVTVRLANVDSIHIGDRRDLADRVRELVAQRLADEAVHKYQQERDQAEHKAGRG